MNEPVTRRSKDTKDTWQTPDDLLASVQAFGSWLGAKGITLDPATVKDNPTRAEYIRTPDCDPDGLETEWFDLLSDKTRLVYVNPPYRAAWYKKIALEAVRMAHAGKGAHMIALLPAKPGTSYFIELQEHATAILFIRGRLTFKGAPDPAPFESALLYFGKSPHQFRASFEGLGWVV